MPTEGKTNIKSSASDDIQMSGGISFGTALPKGVSHMVMYNGRDIYVTPAQEGGDIRIGKDMNNPDAMIHLSIPEYDDYLAANNARKREIIEQTIKHEAPKYHRELTETLPVSGNKTVNMKMFGGRNIEVVPNEFGADIYVARGAGNSGKADTVRMGTREYERFLSMNGSQRKNLIDQIIRLRNPNLYNDLKANEATDLYKRSATRTPYTADGTPIFYNKMKDSASTPDHWRRYPDEPLNSRLSNVSMDHVKEDQGVLRMNIDGVAKLFPVTGLAFQGWNNGSVPINVLANKTLEIFDRQQFSLQSKYEMNISEGQNESLGQGFRR